MAVSSRALSFNRPLLSVSALTLLVGSSDLYRPKNIVSTMTCTVLSGTLNLTQYTCLSVCNSVRYFKMFNVSPRAVLVGIR